MDANTIYTKIVDRAKNRTLEGYKERHHIIPKCVGGSNLKENIVALTAREHFICHRLLVKIYPESHGLQYALWAMCNQHAGNCQRDYKINSYTYERLRKLVSAMSTKLYAGRKMSPESIAKGVAKRTGQKKQPYKDKVLKFECTCRYCNNKFNAADVKCYTCKSCKEPRSCKCGCGLMVKTPGRYYFYNHDKRGKTYLEIYGTSNPGCGHRKGKDNAAKRPEIRKKISEGLAKAWKDGKRNKVD